MSCCPAKYVKFRHRTLLFYATHIEATTGAAFRTLALSSSLGGDRDTGAPLWRPYGFSGLRFGFLGVFGSRFVAFLAVKLCGPAVRFRRRAVKLCSLDVMWLRHDQCPPEKQRHNARY
jgi:hypothetical protein